MAKKITFFPVLEFLEGTEVVPVVIYGENFSISLNSLKTLFDKADVNLPNVDNTSDANKPVSVATQLALDGKANFSHTHLISDIAGLQNTLNTKAAVYHAHYFSEIIDGETMLNTKADVNHLHSIDDVNGLSISLNNLTTSLGTKANISHLHTIANINGLQNALDSKASLTYVDNRINDVIGLAPENLNTLAELADFLNTNTGGLIVDLSNKANIDHTHSISETTGLQAVLDSKATVESVALKADASLLAGKADINHNHTVSNISGLQNALDGKASVASVVNKADISALATKADLAHVHDIADVNNLQTALDEKATNASVATKADVNHTHAISAISGLQTALDSKASITLVNTKANNNHSHVISDVADLQTTLDTMQLAIDDKSPVASLNTKADIIHSHSISDVTDLQATLNSKADDSDVSSLASSVSLALTAKADISHTHSIAQISGLQLALDDKANNTDVALKANALHNHSISDVSGLQTALDNKAAVNHTHAGQLLPNATANQIPVYDGGNWVAQNIAYDLSFAASDESTAITVGSSKVSIRTPRAFKITNVYASLTTAQVSGSLFTVNVNVNGNSILSTLLTFDNAEKISSTAVTPVVLNTNPNQLNLLDEISIDVTQVGDGTAKGLKIYLVGHL